MQLGEVVNDANKFAMATSDEEVLVRLAEVTKDLAWAARHLNSWPESETGEKFRNIEEECVRRGERYGKLDILRSLLSPETHLIQLYDTNLYTRRLENVY